MPDFSTWVWQDYCFYGGIVLLFIGFIADILSAAFGKREHASLLTIILLWIIFSALWYYGLGWLLGRVI